MRLCDSTFLGCANYPGRASRSAFAGFASHRYQKSQHRFLWRARLVLLSDLRGVLLGYTLVPASEKEYEALADLVTGTESELVIADKGCGTAVTASGSPPGVELLTPAKERSLAKRDSRTAACLGPVATESVFFQLAPESPFGLPPSGLSGEPNPQAVNARARTAEASP